MLRRIRRAVLALSIFGIVLYADTEWAALRQQARNEAKAGRFEEAAKTLRAAIAALPAADSLAATTLWNELGSVEHSRHLLDEGNANFERALSINKQLRVPDANQTAVALNNLATIAGERHQLTRAEAFLREAYALLDGSKPVQRGTAALIRTNLAMTLVQEGRYLEALPIYRVAGEEVKAQFGEKSIEYARLAANRALLELKIGRYAEAVTDGRNAIAAQESLTYVPISDRALAANNLGSALLQLNDLTSAERYLNDAVRLWQSMGKGDEQLVSAFNNLGALYEKRQEFGKARRAEESAVGVLDSGTRVDNLTAAAIWNNLGRLASDEHKFRQAHEYLNKARELAQGDSSPALVQYAAVLSNLAGLETAEKHWKRAESLYRKALAIDEAQLGPNHPEVASDLSNIATELVYQKHLDAALELYEKAGTIAVKSFGEVSEPVAHNWRNMAVAYYENKQFSQSALAYSKALAASANPNVPGWWHEYAHALRKANRFGEAEIAETRAVGIEVKNTLVAEKSARPKTQGDSGEL